jgi:hypothetical protein
MMILSTGRVEGHSNTGDDDAVEYSGRATLRWNVETPSEPAASSRLVKGDLNRRFEEQSLK